MPKVLMNVRAFVGGCDLTGFNNKFEIAGAMDEKETTSFGSEGNKEFLGGLGSAAITAEGQWSAGGVGDPDDTLSAALGTVGPWSVCDDGANFGDVAWLVKALESKYTIGGAIGDVAPWSAGVSSSSPLVRGRVLHPPGTARTSTGSGTGYQIGAVPANQFMWVNLHVLSIAGTSTPTITVTVQSDDNSGFTSATTRGTFTAVTAANQPIGQNLRIAGAIADDWWRIGFTISGSTPSFLLYAAAGIA